jgi:hypothetical protein
MRHPVNFSLIYQFPKQLITKKAQPLILTVPDLPWKDAKQGWCYQTDDKCHRKTKICPPVGLAFKLARLFDVRIEELFVYEEE